MIPIERYIVPLDAIIETKSYKDLMEKEIKNTKILLIFIKVIRKEFNKLDKGKYLLVLTRKMMLSLMKLNLKHC